MHIGDGGVKHDFRKAFPLSAFAAIRGTLRSGASPISATVMDATKLLYLILNGTAGMSRLMLNFGEG